MPECALKVLIISGGKTWCVCLFFKGEDFISNNPCNLNWNFSNYIISIIILWPRCPNSVHFLQIMPNCRITKLQQCNLF